MSTNLLWEIYKPKPGKRLGLGIKYAIQGEYGNEAVLTELDIPFLKGVRAGHAQGEIRDDCDTLIDAIATHGTIRVWVSG